MTKEAQKYYERIYSKKWDEFTQGEKDQLEKREQEKLPAKGDKILKKERSRYHTFPKNKNHL